MSCSTTTQNSRGLAVPNRFTFSICICLGFLSLLSIYAFQSTETQQKKSNRTDTYQSDSLAISNLMAEARSWYGKRRPDQAILRLREALQLNESTIQSRYLEAAIRQILGTHYTAYGAETEQDSAVQNYRIAIDLNLEFSNIEEAIRIGHKLAGNYYRRRDSSSLQSGPISREILKLFESIPAKDHQRVRMQKNGLMLLVKSAKAYHSIDVADIPIMKDKHKKANQIASTAWNLHNKGGFPDSAAVYRQEAMQLFEEVLEKLDDPIIWGSYLRTRLQQYDYLRIAKLMPSYHVEQRLDLEHLYETLRLTQEKLGPEQQGTKDNLICSLASHIKEEAPDKALEILLSAPESWRCMTQLEELYHDLGNIEQAIVADRRRYETSKSNRYHKALASQDLALSLLLGGYYKEAETYARISLENLINTIEPTHARWAFAYYRLGAALTGQGKLVEALEMIEKAEPIMMAIEGEIAGGPIREIYTEHAKILMELERFTAAEEYVRKAFLCTAYEPNISWANELRLLNINLLSRQQRYAEAIDSAHVLQQFLQPKGTSLKQVILQKDLLKAFKVTADVFYREYLASSNIEQLSLAYQNYKRAIDMVDVIRQSYHWESSKLFLLKESQSLYAQAIQVGLELTQLKKDQTYRDEVFNFVEKRKGILLLEALQGEQPQVYTGMPTEVLQEEERIQLILTQYRNQLYIEQEKGDENDQTRIARLRDQVFKYTKSHDSLMVLLKNKYPDYYELNYSIKLTSIEQIQRLLKPKQEAFINYLVEGQSIYAFVLTADQYEIIQLPSVDLASQIQGLQKSIFTPYLLDSLSLAQSDVHNATWIEYAHQLYLDLIAPIEGQIDLPEKLIISPDGPLGYLPFELLLRELPGNYSNFGSHSYLVNDYQVSYTYSATLLQEMQDKNYSAARPNLIAFAPQFEGSKTDLKKPLFQIRGDLGELEFNIPEAIGVTDILGGTAITGIEATEKRFLSEAPKYQIIHLSTHGKANDEQGDYSFLAFTEMEDSLDNGFLYTRDLYNMEIKADMVVLSACETGIGELQNGEGVISLARGFSYAGAKSIITTLWSVNDASSKELMEGFYAYIKEGRTKDEALRQAKLDFIEKHVNEAHPFFWAPFIAIGDMEAIQFTTKVKYVYFGLGLLLISFLYWNNRNKRKVRNLAA